MEFSHNIDQPPEADQRIAEAAEWLADEASPPHPVMPAIRQRFSLSTVQAVAAIRAANQIRGARR